MDFFITGLPPSPIFAKIMENSDYFMVLGLGFTVCLDPLTPDVVFFGAF